MLDNPVSDINMLSVKKTRNCIHSLIIFITYDIIIIAKVSNYN